MTQSTQHCVHMLIVVNGEVSLLSTLEAPRGFDISCFRGVGGDQLRSALFSIPPEDSRTVLIYKLWNQVLILRRQDPLAPVTWDRTDQALADFRIGHITSKFGAFFSPLGHKIAKIEHKKRLQMLACEVMNLDSEYNPLGRWETFQPYNPHLQATSTPPAQFQALYANPNVGPMAQVEPQNQQAWRLHEKQPTQQRAYENSKQDGELLGGDMLEKAIESLGTNKGGSGKIGGVWGAINLSQKALEHKDVAAWSSEMPHDVAIGPEQF